jgi:hypothetical protein
MNYKKIGLLGVFISFLLNGYFLKDYFKKTDNIVRVSFECKYQDSKEDEVFKYLETYRFKDNRIYSTHEITDKENTLSTIKELEDCVVIDSKNWTCGGKIQIIGNMTILNEAFTLNNGKFSYHNRSELGNADRFICRSKQLG